MPLAKLRSNLSMFAGTGHPTEQDITRQAVPVGQGATDTVPGNTSSTVSVAIGGSVSGAVNSGGDQDWYRVNLVAGRTYNFDLNGSGATPLGDTYLTLYNASGGQITYDDDGGPGYNSHISFTATATGTYYLGVRGYSSSYTGGYTLSAAEDVPLVYSFAGIADYLQTGYWNANGSSARQFDVTTISYNLSALTPEGQALARSAIQLWDDVCGLTFTETSGAALITFDDSDTGAYSYSNTSGGIISTSFVNVGLDWLNAYGTGIDTYSFQTYIHEIGHALGLGHAGPYNGSATYGSDNVYDNDTWQYTIMSYFDQSNFQNGSYRFVVGPQIADILAVTEFYGASTNTRTGNTTYGFNSNAGGIFDFTNFTTAPALTIFDSRGTDTLDLSGYADAQYIDLGPGRFSNVGGLTGNIGIALNATIENAIGGTGNDRVIGNSAANVLNGRGGNDSLTGGSGNDRLSGDTGNDYLNGGSGIDTLDGGAGNDIYFLYTTEADVIVEMAGQGIDTIYASSTRTLNIASLLQVENLRLTGSAVANGTGNGLNNVLVGNSGSNRLYGLGGNDKVSGGVGSDLLSGGAGNDTLVGGAGNDRFVFDVAGGTANRDTVSDFNVADDAIWIENAIYTALGSVTGAINAAMFWSSSTGTAHDATDRIIYNTATGALVYDENGDSAGGAFQFARLTAGLNLTSLDVIVF